MNSGTADREGIVRDENTGELYIPASKRPDGTWRKPRKVKDGYVPPEEVPVYENKGVQWLKSRPNLPPGLSLSAEEIEAAKRSPSCVNQTSGESSAFVEVMSKSAKKNQKRKEKKKQKNEEDSVPEQLASSLANASLSDKSSKIASNILTASSVNTFAPSTADSTQDLEKRVRNLKKKLKQIDDLEKRVKSGEIKPEKEQLEKISRRAEIADEIEELEQELKH